MTDKKFNPKEDDYRGWAFKMVEEVGELQEALGRLVAAFGKTGRHGFRAYDPTVPEDQRETNAAWILREMGDVEEGIDKVRDHILVVPDFEVPEP
jgi:hypothetical protein